MPTAPPLLLIMGLAAQMIAWDDEFCTLLAARGYHVDPLRQPRHRAVVPDRERRACPTSAAAFMAAMQGKPIPSPPYLLSDMADDAVGLLDALGIEPRTSSARRWAARSRRPWRSTIPSGCAR